jgi:hypothetical protein
MLYLFLQTRLLLFKQFAALFQKLRGPHPEKPLGNVLQSDPVLSGALLGATEQAAVQVIQQLEPIVETPARVNAREAVADVFEFVVFAFELPTRQVSDPNGRFSYKFAARKNTFRDNLRRGAGGSSTHVRDKVANGEIDFVANGGDDRQGGLKDRSCDDFFVERPQIFEGTAAARDENQIEWRVESSG